MVGRLVRSLKGKARAAALRIPGVLRDRPRAYWFRGTPNFGDQLSPQIVEWMTGTAPIWVPRSYPRKLLSTGSILQAAARTDVVWGSGLIRGEPFEPPPDVTFLAVRGPLSRSLITADVPEVYGDPAVVLPHFHRVSVDRRCEIGVVPHYVDRSAVRISDPSIMVIDVRQPWRQVVDQIRSCDVIVSSSLHGLIVAEAYGIPASWVRISNEIVGGNFKFNDYYLSSGRDERTPIAWSEGLSAAISAIAPPARIDTRPLLEAGKQLAGLPSPVTPRRPAG